MSDGVLPSVMMCPALTQPVAAFINAINKGVTVKC